MDYIKPNKISLVAEYYCIIDGVKISYNTEIKRDLLIDILTKNSIELTESKIKEEKERIIETSD